MPIHAKYSAVIPYKKVIKKKNFGDWRRLIGLNFARNFPVLTPSKTKKKNKNDMQNIKIIKAKYI
jgi:hypothetical protein